MVEQRFPLFVLVGATGVGKGSIMEGVFKRLSGLRHARSWTTRLQRPGESDAAYFFTTEEAFRGMIKDGRFLEWAQPFLEDAYKPAPTYYGRTEESFADLGAYPCLCDMTEHGVQELEKIFGRDGRQMVVIRIEGRNMRTLERRGERTSADELRAQIGIAVHYTIVNDHADGGLEKSIVRLIEIMNTELARWNE